MTSKTDAPQPGTGLVEALHVTGPAAEFADKLRLFGRFVGSWCREWTIRFYGAAIDAWRSTWIEPVNGRVRRFIGRADGIGRAGGSDIVLLSEEDDPRLRWRFTDVTADSFTWRREFTRREGQLELLRANAGHPK